MSSSGSQPTPQQIAAAQALAAQIATATQAAATTIAAVTQTAAAELARQSQPPPQPRPAYKRAGVRVTDLSADAQEEAIGRYQQYLFDAQIKFSDVLSAAIMTLSGGALVASITFIEKIIGSGPVEGKFVLFGAWGCFIAAILCTLFGLQMGVQATRDDLAVFHGQDLPPRKYPNAIGHLRLFAIAVLSGGFVLLAGFAFLNAAHDWKRGTNVATTTPGTTATTATTTATATATATTATAAGSPGTEARRLRPGPTATAAPASASVTPRQ